MTVFGKMDETGMRTDIDQLSHLQHLPAVHDEFLSGCVDTLMHAAVSLENLFFFR